MPSKGFENFIPNSRKDFVSPKPIGMGSRIIVFPENAGQYVVRAPIKSEQDLVERYGESGQYAKNNGQGPISKYTAGEVDQYAKLKKVLGQFTVGVTTFPDYDQDGILRTYSHQRRIHDGLDLTDGWNFDKLSETARENMRKFVHKVRNMVKKYGLIPDFAGRGNVLLDKNDDVWVVDINNIRPVLPNGDYLKDGVKYEDALKMLRTCEIWNEEGSKYRTGIQKVLAFMLEKGIIHEDYLDEHGLDIADQSMDMLRIWESRLDVINSQTVDKDPFYQKFFDKQRRDIMDAIGLHRH